jgi:pantothenate kinase type III
VRSLLAHTGGIARRATKPAKAAGARRSAPALRPLADNTLDAIELGSLTASAALIDRVVAELRPLLGARPLVYLTGGAAPQLAPLLKSASRPCDDLVLRGLAVLAEAAARRKA